MPFYLYTFTFVHIFTVSKIITKDNPGGMIDLDIVYGDKEIKSSQNSQIISDMTRNKLIKTPVRKKRRVVKCDQKIFDAKVFTWFLNGI